LHRDCLARDKKDREKADTTTCWSNPGTIAITCFGWSWPINRTN
jgi:hypothetical protein